MIYDEDSDKGLDDYFKDDSDHEPPKPAVKAQDKSKYPTKKKEVSEDSEIEEDYVDYDEEFLDESINDKVKDQFKIAQTKPIKEEPKKESKPAETKQTSAFPEFGQAEQSKPANNKFLNQFHTVKKSEPSEEIEDSEVESEENEEENKALVETFIRLYKNDPDSLGEFERELVEKELKARDPNFKPKSSSASNSQDKESPKVNSTKKNIKEAQNPLKTESIERKLDSVIGHKPSDKSNKSDKPNEVKQPEITKKSESSRKSENSDSKSLISEKKPSFIQKKSESKEKVEPKAKKQSKTEESKDKPSLNKTKSKEGSKKSLKEGNSAFD